MQGAKDLIASERGIFCLLVLIAATMLAIIRIITGQSWLDFTKWLTITLVASKTATTAVDAVMAKKPMPVAPPTASS
jgi:hypothetical protein